MTYSCGSGKKGCDSVGALGVGTKICHCDFSHCDPPTDLGLVARASAVTVLLAAFATAAAYNKD